MTSQQSETLLLNCLPQGEDGYGGFEVSVTLTSKVAVLKKAICEEVRMGWDPNDIDLWQVSIPIDDDKTIRDLKLKEQEGVTLLRSLVYLQRYFLSSPPQPEHIHIIVERRSAPRNALVGSVGAQKRLAENDGDPNNDDSTLESLRQDLVLKIQNTDKIMDQDLRNNNIDRQDLLGQLIFYSRDNLVVYPEETVVATQDVTGVPHLGEHTSEDTPSGAPVVVHVPKHAKDFHDRLVAPLPYRDDDDRVKHRISILEFHLGVVEVKKHIVPAVNGLSWHYFERLDSALSLFCQTQPAYSTNITGLTCEAWCTAPVVDRILVGISNYFRDKSHATIVTENSSGSKTSWKPRNDFVVSYLEDAHGYAVLHGETASTNETADDASNKTAIMSLHSLKMLRHYTGRNDHVILTVYVSYARCLLHLLFYDDKKPGKEPGYVQLCVFDGNNIFVPERLSLLAEFIRRILNFARFCHPGGPTSLSDPEYKHQIQLVKQLSVDLPSKNSKTSHHSRGQGQSDRSKYKAREQDIIPLTQMGYYITRIPHEMYKSDRVVLLRKSKSDQVFVAKRTTAVEVQFIKSLLSARSHKYENHTIPYKHVIQSNTAHPYLVMPYYSDLSSLRSLSPQLYPHLRLQLIEGVAFMHEQGVVHRDLKPSNIVLDFKEYRLFIIDYDLSRHQSPGEQCFGYCGTEGWTAPEIQDNASWDPRSADIWALANVLRYLSKRTGCPDLDIERVLTLGPAERPSAERLLESFRTSLKRGLPLHDGLPFPKRPHTISNLGVEDSILSCCTDVDEMDS